MDKHELGRIGDRRHTSDRRHLEIDDLHERLDRKMKQIEMERRQADRRRAERTVNAARHR